MAGDQTGDPLKTIEKVIGLFCGVVSQIPAGSVAVAGHPLSLYQPLIYEGKELFLLIPVVLAVFSVWLGLRNTKGILVLLVLTLTLAGLVWWIYDGFPASHRIHAVNWLLSYCVLSLASGVVAGVVT